MLFEMELFFSGKFQIKSAYFASIKDQKVISNFLFNESTEIIFDRGRYQTLNHRKASPLDICPKEKYLRNTIESAALNTSYYIYKTHKKFTEVHPDIFVSPVTLNITPEIIQSNIFRDFEGKAIKSSSYMSDNAFYMNQTNAIIFLPHSETFHSSMDINYWEIPMVASHEYGHHLFKMVYGSPLTTLSQGCFGDVKEKKSEKNIFTRKVSIDDVINAYNEGFADLIAYYSLNRTERDVSGVKCLEVTRETGSPTFYDGKLKVFSDEVLDDYFSPLNRYTFDTCEVTNFQHSHAIGSILAHTSDKFFSHLSLTRTQKLKVIVSWVKYLRNEKLASSSPREWMKKTISELYRMSVMHSGKSFNEKTCEKIQDNFPGLTMPECEL
jgi:hypothetical protein